ncbi:30S ribosomal protein S6 [Abyssisolibacter fermentans]|uniref:30S ribosomal protein S6 n=1 Tax=Abyssisolibacter fermentans TaxID=1766203 RepID=UPI00082C36FD|nr:30S ribosomal protein S6 [Abyssisolibacter fermentans]
MKKYEAVFIFRSNLEEADRVALFDKLKGIIETDGSVSKVDEWGLRKLAYEIKDQREGYYILINFEASHKSIQELDRITKISEPVLRHLIVRVEE